MLEALVRKFLYYPEKLPARAPVPDYCGPCEEVWIETGSGSKIWGLYWSAPAQGRPTVLFFHGNAQSAYEWALVREDLEELESGMLLIDYPGYGKTPGSPSERALYEAGRASLRWLADRVAKERILVFGKSLGGGVAVEVCRNEPVGGLILESTFTSIPSVASKLLPLVPRGLFPETERYESLSRLHELTCPILVVHGTQDELIPVQEGRSLFEAAPEPKELYLVEGAGHNNVALVAGQEYGRRLRNWMDRNMP